MNAQQRVWYCLNVYRHHFGYLKSATLPWWFVSSLYSQTLELFLTKVIVNLKRCKMSLKCLVCFIVIESIEGKVTYTSWFEMQT